MQNKLTEKEHGQERTIQAAKEKFRQKIYTWYSKNRTTQLIPLEFLSRGPPWLLISPLTLLVTQCVEHTMLCDICWASYCLTQCWHCLPWDSTGSRRVRARPHRTALHTTHTHFRCQLQASVLLTDQLWDGGSNPLLEFGSFARGAQQTQRNTSFHLLVCWGHDKGCRSAARWRATPGEGPEHRSFCSCGAGVHHPPRTWMSPPAWGLSEPHATGTLWRLPHKGMINY